MFVTETGAVAKHPLFLYFLDLPVKTGTFGCCLPPNPLRHRASRFGMPYEAWCAREGLPSPSDLPTDLILCDHTCSSE